MASDYDGEVLQATPQIKYNFSGQLKKKLRITGVGNAEVGAFSQQKSSAANSGVKESDNHAGILIHGTDVSASYSQLPVNQLDSFSEFNMAGLNGVKKSSNESINRCLPGAKIDKMQVFAAGL